MSFATPATASDALQPRAADHAARLAPFDPDLGPCGALLARRLDCDLAGGPAAGVERAATAVARAEVRRILASACPRLLGSVQLDAPGVDAWLLREDGRAVSAMVATADPDLVAVWAIGTPPALRRSGRAGRLARAVLGHYALEGAETALLATPPGTEPLAHALGFARMRTSHP